MSRPGLIAALVLCAAATAAPKDDSEILMKLRESATAVAPTVAPVPAPQAAASAAPAATPAPVAEHGLGFELKPRILDAQALGKTGKRQEAEQIYNEIIDSVKSRIPETAGRLVCADSREIFQRFDSLRSEFARPGVWVDTTYAYALYVLGSLAMKDKNWEKARSHLTPAVQCAPYMSDFYRALGLTLCQLGETAASDKAYSVAAELMKSRHRELIEMLTEQRGCAIARAKLYLAPAAQAVR